MKPTRLARVSWGILIGAALSLAPGAHSASLLFDQVVLARDLVCEFSARGDGAVRRGMANNRADNLMVYIENVNGATRVARLVSSRTVGARAVQVYAGDTGVHFVEDVAASVKVTSLLSCQYWKNGSKGRKCIRYEAVNNWHFDTSVHRDADQAYLRLPQGASYRGWCEPWHVD